MTGRVLVLALVAMSLTGQPSLPIPLPLRHGTLVPLPYYIDRDGVRLTSERWSFLAVQMDTDPTEVLPVDYVESGISRRVFTDEALDRWLILPISKGCAPVVVCPPLPWSYGKDSCLVSPIVPMFAGVPIGCPGNERRRAVRK